MLHLWALSCRGKKTHIDQAFKLPHFARGQMMHSDLLIKWRILLACEPLNRQIMPGKKKKVWHFRQFSFQCLPCSTIFYQTNNEIMKWWCPAKNSAVRNNRNMAWDSHCVSFWESWGRLGMATLPKGAEDICSLAYELGPAVSNGVNVTLCLWCTLGMPSSTEQLVKENSGCQDRFQFPLPTIVCFLNFLLLAMTF